jgi:5-methylcytosine-specific restriction enzyme subunit McrC
MRQNIIHKEKFVVNYDEFTDNVAENKLIKNTLLYLNKCSKTSNNQKRIREMLFIFDEIETSKDIDKDLKNCNINNRLQSHYIEVMKRVQLFLNKQSLVNFA